MKALISRYHYYLAFCQLHSKWIESIKYTSSREKNLSTSEDFDRLICGRNKEVLENAWHFVGCILLRYKSENLY